VNMQKSINDSVKRFVLENLLYRDSGKPLDEDASFLEEGLIDSTGIVHLVTFLEERFEIRIADSDVVPENLDSVARIVRYVNSRQGRNKRTEEISIPREKVSAHAY